MGEETIKTTIEELLYLAAQQRHERGMMRDDDYGGIRQSIIIEAALKRWSTQIGTLSDTLGARHKQDQQVKGK